MRRNMNYCICYEGGGWEVESVIGEGNKGLILSISCDDDDNDDNDV